MLEGLLNFIELGWTGGLATIEISRARRVAPLTREISYGAGIAYAPLLGSTKTNASYLSGACRFVEPVEPLQKHATLRSERVVGPDGRS